MSDEDFYGTYKVRALRTNECVKNFHCGDEELDDFILHESQAYSEAMIATTYLVVDRHQEDKVVAYFSLANDKLSVNDFSSNSEFNRFRKRRFVHEKRLRSYPAVKLCRLGVDTSLKGKGIGSILLRFLITLYLSGNRAGCRFITVDAYKTAIPFYKNSGFVSLSNKADDLPTSPLYFDLKSSYQ